MSEMPHGGWQDSAEAWIAFVDQGDPNREMLLDVRMLALCGDVRGLTVVDVGCGEGRFLRKLSGQGATLIGLEPTPTLAEVARSRTPEATIHTAPAEQTGLPDACADLVISYITLVDIPGYREAIHEFARVLRPGGRVVVANISPFFATASSPWVRDAGGNKLHVALDKYMTEVGLHCDWRDIRVVNYHRPLSAYFRAFLDSGLILETYDEVTPTPEEAELRPVLLEEFRVPNFVTYSWRKP